MRNTFKDPELQSKLDKLGYVVIDNVLSEQQMLELEKFYMNANAMRRDTDHANISSLHDKSLQPKMWAMLIDTFKPFVETYFDAHHQIAGHYITKHPGPNTELYVHQDASVVDESQYRCLSIWVPLIDVVDEEIGPIQVLEGSHLLNHTYRNHTLQTPFSQIFDNFAFCTPTGTSTSGDFIRLRDALNARFKDVPVKRGQCLVFSTKLFHRSKALQKDVIRIAAGGLVAPVEAPLYHYFGAGDGIIEEYGIDTKFFSDYETGVRPERYKLLRTIECDMNTLQPADEALLWKLSGIEPLPEPQRNEGGAVKRLMKRFYNAFA